MTNVDGIRGPASLKSVDWLIWGLVAAAPALHALVSWDPAGRLYPAQSFYRAFSIPITLVELVVLGFAIFVGCGPLRTIGRMPVWARIVLGLLVAIALGTALFVARSSGTSQVRTYAWLVHLLFGFSLFELLKSRWSLLRPSIWPTAVVGVLLYIAILIAFVLAIPNEATFDWKRLWLGVTHIRQVGFYSLVGGAGAIGLAAIARSTSRYWIATGIASLCLALSYWSGTRGSLVAVLAAFLAGLVLLPAMRSLRAIGALVIANAAGALISLVNLPPHPFYGIVRMSRSSAVSGADELASGRLTQWKDSARAVLEHPLFGWGESQYPAAAPLYGQFNHPHNFPIQIAISWGLVGLACVLALGVLLAWRFVGGARAGGGDMIAPFLVAFGLATMALYEGSFYHPYPLMMAVVAAAFVLAAPVRASTA